MLKEAHSDQVYSALLLMALWAAFMAAASHSNRFASDDYVPIAFVSAMASASLLSAFLIETNAINYVRDYGWLFVLALLASVVASPRGINRVATGVATYLRFRNDELDVGSPSNQSGRFSSRIRMIRKGLLVFVIGIVIVTSLFQANPMNWDSNTYNLARIPAMILAKTITLTEAGSTRQALYPLGHDLLYYYDLSLGNLRGLSLINASEWLVALGSLFCLTQNLVKVRKHHGSALLQVSYLFVLCLFLASDLQLFQALSTKNDLVVLMLFLLTLHIVIRKLVGNLSLQRSEMIAVFCLFAAYSIHCKSYGIIILMPIVVGAFFGLFSPSCPDAKTPFAQIRFRNKTNFLFLGLLILLAAAHLMISLYHSQTIARHYDSAVVKALTSNWVNTSGTLSDRFENMGLNLIRFLVVILAYPFSTYLKLQPKAPDDYLFGMGPIGSLLGVQKGLAKGQSFTFMRNFTEDSAVFSELIHLIIFILIVTGFISLLRVLLVRRYSLKTWISFHLMHPVGTSLALTSILTLCALASILLFQQWIARFLGPVYVPLYPLMAVELAAFVEKLRLDKENKIRVIPALAFLLVLLPVLAIVRFLTVTALMGLSSTWNRSSWSQYPGRVYFEATYSYGHSFEKIRKFLETLEKKPYSNVIVCYTENHPSLIPLFKLAMNPSAQSARIILGNEKTCQGKPNPSQQNPPEYIYLP